jgi:hypothetical protein
MDADVSRVDTKFLYKFEKLFMAEKQVGTVLVGVSSVSVYYI